MLFTSARVLQRRMSCCPSHRGQESRPFQALLLAYGLKTQQIYIIFDLPLTVCTGLAFHIYRYKVQGRNKYCFSACVPPWTCFVLSMYCVCCMFYASSTIDTMSLEIPFHYRISQIQTKSINNEENIYIFINARPLRLHSNLPVEGNA